MPIIQPDTSEQLDMTPLEPGTYGAKIDKVEFEQSKKGNPMIVVYFQVEKEPGKFVPRRSYLVITGEGAYGFDQLLRATGFASIADAYKDKSANKPPFDTDNLVGQELMVVVESTTYNNELRDQIKTYLAA